MTYRDIAVCVTSLSPDLDLIDQAAALAEIWTAHLTCAAMGVQPIPIFTDGMLGLQGEVIAQYELNAAELRDFRSSLRNHLAAKAINATVQDARIYIDGLAEATAAFARYTDLLIARMVEQSDRAHHAEIIEGALFGGGRPVLAIPQAWTPGPIGRRAVLAWDASREASRAIHDALAMLPAAAEICVVTVDAKIGPGQHGEGPGLDIAAHLARHGLCVTVRNEDSLGKPVGERIVEAALGFNADMIIMGAYRRPKLVQRLMAGPSQFLIGKSPVPVFLSR